MASIKSDQNNQHSRTFRVTQLSDSHLFAHGDGRLRGLDTGSAFERVLSAAAEELNHTDLILLTGDLAERGEAGAYRAMASRLDEHDRPVAALPGNHDDPDELARHFSAPLREMGLEIELGQWRLLLLDTTIMGESGGRLGTQRLDWLRAQLAEQARRPVLVALHHPPLPVGSPWMDEIGLADGLELRTCLDQHPQVRGVLFGHAHQTFDVMHGSVRYLGCPSTCVQFTPHTDSPVTAEGPPGWRAISLRPNGTLLTSIRYASTPDE